MSIHIKQLEKALDKSFKGLIDLTDVSQHAPPNLRKMFLTRSLAAYSLHVLAGIPREVAADAVVDGFEDMGIDAVHVDHQRKTLWIVQSKWIASGNGCPDRAELAKFRDGVKRLHELDFPSDNARLLRKARDVRDALTDPNVRERLVLVYTGTPLNKKSHGIIGDFIIGINKHGEIAEFISMPLAEIHRRLREVIEGQPFDAQIGLENWGQFSGPYTSYYGYVQAQVIAEWWANRRERLFSQNIRAFLGTTDVNSSIRNTLRTEPENFWYFNNGITILCSKIKKTLLFGDKSSSGVFDCCGVSIVNGLQTVGTIGEAYLENPASLNEAKVFVRLISLENCPADFAKRVTRATNTQNQVEIQDFVSLCQQQQRLRKELLYDGVDYELQHRSLDAPHVKDHAHCCLREATEALACESTDVGLAIAVIARNLDPIWRDITIPPYTALFNNKLTGTRLWRAIRVFRDVEARTASGIGFDLSQRVVVCYGWHLIAHLVFRMIDPRALEDTNFDFETFCGQELPAVISAVIADLARAYRKVYRKTNRLHFSLNSVCRKLRSAVLKPNFIQELRATGHDSETASVTEIVTWAEKHGLVTDWRRTSAGWIFASYCIEKESHVNTMILSSSGKISLPLDHLSKYPPFDTEIVRLVLLERLNRIPGVSIPATQNTSRVSLPLTQFSGASERACLLQILAWMAAQIGKPDSGAQAAAKSA